MKQICTTLADRRRAGPPAFRRKYRQKLIATLSFPRWSAPSVHSNFRGRGRAPSPSPLSKINLRRFFQSTPDLGNEPIELAQILHAAPI